jgi:hypothetical protein
VGNELQQVTALIENPQSSILGTGQITGGIDHVLQNGGEVQGRSYLKAKVTKLVEESSEALGFPSQVLQFSVSQNLSHGLHRKDGRESSRVESILSRQCKMPEATALDNRRCSFD